MMDIQQAINSYTNWLKSFTILVEEDLQLKCEQMKKESFIFLRATYFRWAQVFELACPDLCQAPVVTAVGDLHIENFGTWRDSEGRLIWGINDFDEAYPLPFTNDLVRLTTSAFLAIEENHLQISRKDAATAVLKGYVKGLKKGGRPYVLEEKHRWLRAIALSKLKEPVRFWKRLDKIPPLESQLPDGLSEILTSAVPAEISNVKIAHRIAGMGSLGLPRYIVMGKWAGGLICREIKYFTPSALIWAKKLDAINLYYQEIIDTSIRCKDPFFSIRGEWTLRRLSPHCSKINLHLLPVKRDEKKLLFAMGVETANIHLGSSDKKVLLRYLKKIPDNWLYKSSKHMQEVVNKDWNDYRNN